MESGVYYSTGLAVMPHTCKGDVPISIPRTRGVTIVSKLTAGGIVMRNCGPDANGHGFNFLQEHPINNPLFFLSAAEHSGDALGAALIEALRQEFPTAEFRGIGGAKMAAAGCTLLADPTRNSAMLLGALSQIGFWLKLLKQAEADMRLHRPAVVIPIDSPPVNIRVARIGRRLNTPVCYYVAPQLWAWAPWRISRLIGVVDTLCCVLPFEENYFRQRHVHGLYVGHPLFDVATPMPTPAATPSAQMPQSTRSAPSSQRSADGPLPASPIKVALLPGSRQAEVQGNLPPMLDVVRQVRSRFSQATFAIAAADDSRAWQIRALLRSKGEVAEVRTGMTDAIIDWADMVITVSGTATLQVASRHKPMVVMYALAAWKWKLAGQFLVQSRYLSLVNILADRELVPEFMPFYGSTKPLAAAVLHLLENATARAAMTQELEKLVAPMRTFSRQMPASRRVALEVARLMAAQPPA